MEQLLEFVANHALMAGGFIAVLGLLIWTELVRKINGLKELNPAQAVAWINDPKTVVVDVSPAADYNKGHIVNARNIAPSRIQDPDGEVQKLREAKVLVVCKSGQTATQAAASLKKIGVADVAVLKGGMMQWQSDQYPVTKK
jgi:rhodanese-related sulfurtransferase